MRIFQRLYLKIFGAFVLLAVCSVLVGGVAGHLLSDSGPVPPHLHEAAALFVEGLPADPATRAEEFRHRARRLGLDLALYDASGRLDMATSDLPPPDGPGDRWLHDRSRGFPPRPVLAVDLGPTGTLVGAISGPSGDPFRGIHVLLVVALALGLGTYPLARGITRRLERLRQGVDDLGRGDLAARVPVSGDDEVARLARAFNESADRIQALVEGQRRMLASASHELRSPLARLRLSVELIHDAADADERAAQRDGAIRDVAELDRLVEDLLVAGRLEARAPDRPHGPVDLLALAAEEGARVGVEAGGDPVTVPGDEALLRIALRNLLLNALRHGRPGPDAPARVDLRVEVDAGWARVVVEDGGAGLPEAERERVFEPFYRPAGTPEGDGGGAGLGLYLVRRVATLHGGRARCEAGAVGARFVFEVPVG